MGPDTCEQHLVKRMLAGEDEAFEEFFEGCFPGLYRFAMARLRHDADAAEEVVQSTLCRALGKLHTFRGEAALFTWLCTICRHEICDHYRRMGRRPLEALVEEAPEVRAALESLGVDGGVPPEEALLRKELAGQVQTTLDGLPAHYGDALEWKYIQGLSIKEIAERLKLRPEAAKSLLNRARGAFRNGFGSVVGGLEGRAPGAAWSHGG